MTAVCNRNPRAPHAMNSLTRDVNVFGRDTVSGVPQEMRQRNEKQQRRR